VFNIEIQCGDLRSSSGEREISFQHTECLNCDEDIRGAGKITSPAGRWLHYKGSKESHEK